MTLNTRTKILEGAYRTLIGLGYEASSIKDIAREAGVAPGLVHYYFDTKEDLMVAVLEHVCQRPDHSGAGNPIEKARDAFEQLKTSLRDRSDGHRLLLEMAALGLHNPRIAEAVRAFARQDQEQIAVLAAAVIAQQEKYGQADADPIAAAIWAACFGIATLSLLDPKFDASATIDALAILVLT